MYRVGLLLMIPGLLAGCFNPEDPMAGGTDTAATASASTGSGATSSDPSSTSEVTIGPSSTTPTASTSTSTPTTDTDTADTTDSASGDETTTGGSSTCSTPQELSSFPTVGQTTGVALRGIHAYVTETNRGIHVIDIADPNDIAQLGDADLPNPFGVTAAGGYAFVADPTGIIPVDVEFPNAPIPRPALPLGASVSAVAVAADTVYAVTDGNGEPCASCGLYVVDATDPTEMTVLDSLPIGDRAVGVAVEGSFAYVAAGSDGLVTVDIDGLTILDTASAGGGFTADVAVVGEIAYVAAGSSGLVLFDVSDPANIAELGSIAGDFVLAVAVEGNWAWITDSDNGLRIIDISDPTNPAELAAVDTFGSGSDVAVDGGTAFVTSWDGDLRVFAPPVCR